MTSSAKGCIRLRKSKLASRTHLQNTERIR
jgi:hypothetical protein